jgi:hypothetical protein
VGASCFRRSNQLDKALTKPPDEAVTSIPLPVRRNENGSRLETINKRRAGAAESRSAPATAPEFVSMRELTCRLAIGIRVDLDLALRSGSWGSTAGAIRDAGHALRSGMANASVATNLLSAMITPALLISAGGTLVLSTSNRLSRVVERVRILARDAEQLAPTDLSEALQRKRALIVSQLRSLAKRAVILRSALGALYTAIGFLVATSIAVGLLTLFPQANVWPAIGLALLGAVALLWGSVLLVREGRLAIQSTLEEMSYVQTLIGTGPLILAPGTDPASVEAANAAGARGTGSNAGA